MTDSADRHGGERLSDEEQIRREVERRNREAEAMAAADDDRSPGSGGDGDDAITSEFVIDCLHANELGDGIVFARMHRGQYVRNMSTGEWMSWDGHHWQIDQREQVLASVESVALRYLEEAVDLVQKIPQADKQGPLLDLQKKLYKRVRRLRSNRGRMNTLEMAANNPVDALQVLGDDIDTTSMLLACANGVIDLYTGELQDGRPEDYMLKSSPVAYAGVDAPAPQWEAALLEIFAGDQELVDFLGRIFGYAITGRSNLAKLPILCGKGRNGKTLIVETVSAVLGDLAGPIPTEMLLDQGRARSAAGPSPDIMALQGMLLVFGSEVDEGRRFSPSQVKRISGNDTMVGRLPHDKRLTAFRPKHTLIMLTNAKPHAPADDYAFWERVLLIPFTRSFVDREPTAPDEVRADLELSDKLKSEYPGILAWIVRGCLTFQQRGLDPPAVVRDATAEYRRHEDLLADFIEECCVVEKYTECKAAELYSAFRSWWEDNVSKRPPSQKKFGNMMRGRFKKEKHGHYIYYGIGLLAEGG